MVFQIVKNFLVFYRKAYWLPFSQQPAIGIANEPKIISGYSLENPTAYKDSSLLDFDAVQFGTTVSATTVNPNTVSATIVNTSFLYFTLIET